MTHAEQLAAFVVRASYDEMSEASRNHLKVHVLDALGCAIGALDGEPVKLIKDQIAEFGGTGLCTLIGGGRTAPDRAAFYNGALVRYLDFNDSYLARGESCHPSDNLGAVLAASEYAQLSGRELLTALAVAYQVQCRLSDVAPVRAKGFDHVTQGSYAVAAGVAKALGLDQARTASAIAISGTAFNALRVTRTGALSHWKGLAYPNTAFCCTHASFLAMRGITGPIQVFEGNKGFMESIAGQFEIDWSSEHLERITHTIVKKFNAEIHSQSAIEGILELKREHDFNAGEIDRVEIEIFDVAYQIIGGGEEGEKRTVRTKEEADHSLPYLIAVAILDDQVMPAQFRQERIDRPDVQTLLRKIMVQPSTAYCEWFPEEMPCRIAVTLLDGRTLSKEKRDYEGFRTRPITWESAVQKFERVSEPYTTASLRRQIIDVVDKLDRGRVTDLTQLLNKVHTN